MKIGISVPNNWGVPNARRLVDLAVRAEDHGFASVWTSEHMINLAYVRNRIGDGPYYHAFSILSAIAARTSKILLGTSVIVVPFHNPFETAKYVATLDQLSEGRVILGVGVGAMKEEFDVLGIPWEKRGAITDESLDVIRAVWEQHEAKHEGKLWNFSDVHTSPKPYENRRIPIWVGGMSGAATKRTVRIGEGWHPISYSPEEMRQHIADLHELAVAAGRDPKAIDVCMRMNVSLDNVEVTELELRSTVKGGDMKRARDLAEQYRDVGVTHFIFALNSSEPDVLDQQADLFAKELLPHFPT